jgi:NCAIR mutase (PurE)-related protein
MRQGSAEVVWGESKTAPQISGIVKVLRQHPHPVLVTRVSAEKAEAVIAVEPMEYHPEARALVCNREHAAKRQNARLAVLTAGTSDIPVAEEACLTAEMLGLEPVRVYDVGVAGLHRLLKRLPVLRDSFAVVVVAGMEGALPSVVGGLIDKPVIAVPASVGYGAGAGGFAALFGMLSSCASGLTVVNIDNGFGAAFAAFRIWSVHGTTA